MAKQLILIILLPFFLFSCVDPNINKTFHIPEDYSTIQEAIDAAIDGDKIIVDPGIYIENLNFFGKTIKLKSTYESKNDTLTISHTIIDAGYANHAITLNSGEKKISISGFTIRNGIAGGGGAIYCGNSVTAELKDLVLENNIATFGGGILSYHSANLVLDNIDFIGNSCTEQSFGGAIAAYDSNIELSNCNFLRNEASHGGAIYSSFSNINIEQSLFDENQASRGGAIKSIYSAIELTNTLFINNYAANYGSSLYIDLSSKFDITNATFSNNNSKFSWGNIFLQDDSQLNITNSIIWDNIGLDLFISGYGLPCPVDISYSDFINDPSKIITNNNSDFFSEIGNICQDPLFLDANNNDYRLSPISPARNKGNPESEYNNSNGTRNDMGAFGGHLGEWFED